MKYRVFAFIDFEVNNADSKEHALAAAKKSIENMEEDILKSNMNYSFGKDAFLNMQSLPKEAEDLYLRKKEDGK